ncbi:VCBS repeat-containing protein [Amycolatopsis sp. NPDC051128]|uniref:FG-GAP repeat domain-containing protein n=1 Tax=Amycolatopsis sp. NPDC051128 TaxID=3155412 RepID=UPI00342EFFD1
MHRNGIVRTATLTAFAVALGFAGAAPALAASPDAPIHTAADLNGDGTRDDVVSWRAIRGDQVVSATVNGQRTSIHLPADARFGVLPPRVADLNGDGRAELLVATSFGADASTYSVLHFDGRKLSQVVGADHRPFSVAEGGGAAAHLGYMCMAPGGDRLFVTVVSSADDVTRPADEITYTGTRTTYTLRDGVLSVLEEDAFAGRPTSDSITLVDAASCV